MARVNTSHVVVLLPVAFRDSLLFAGKMCQLTAGVEVSVVFGVGQLLLVLNLAESPALRFKFDISTVRRALVEILVLVNTLLQRLLSALVTKAILLFHDTLESTLQALRVLDLPAGTQVDLLSLQICPALLKAVGLVR